MPNKQACWVLKLLARTRGASIAETTKATGWSPHAVRGILSRLKTRAGINYILN
jgi:hypothetical protein